MKAYLVGVFGSRQQSKDQLLGSIAKKSESGGVVVYSRSEAGTRYSFLDDLSYPDRIQGYARVASICDHAYYIFPSDGNLTPADGELAVLIDSSGLDGSILVVDGSRDALQERIGTAFRGLSMAGFPTVERESRSSVIDLTPVRGRASTPADRTLVYVDRVFSVKGVGVVALGFVLSGRVSVHDRLRPLPGGAGAAVEVKGIQISDEDHDTAERGIRVGLSLKGAELKDLEKVSWLDDGTFPLSRTLTLDFRKSAYYRQPLADREMHVQVNGETLTAGVTQTGGDSPRVTLGLANEVPFWEGMPATLIDLNAKQLRVAGGGTVAAGRP